MPIFQQLSARRSLNVSYITNTLKAGEITVTIHASAEAPQLDGQISEAWITQTPRNSYEGLKAELTDREHIGADHQIMELRVCS